jgi:hypothetical protein
MLQLELKLLLGLEKTFEYKQVPASNLTFVLGVILMLKGIWGQILVPMLTSRLSPGLMALLALSFVLSWVLDTLPWPAWCRPFDMST